MAYLNISTSILPPQEYAPIVFVGSDNPNTENTGNRAGSFEEWVKLACESRPLSERSTAQIPESLEASTLCEEGKESAAVDKTLSGSTTVRSDDETELASAADSLCNSLESAEGSCRIYDMKTPQLDENQKALREALMNDFAFYQELLQEDALNGHQDDVSF